MCEDFSPFVSGSKMNSQSYVNIGDKYVASEAWCLSICPPGEKNIACIPYSRDDSNKRQSGVPEETTKRTSDSFIQDNKYFSYSFLEGAFGINTWTTVLSIISETES